MIAVTFPHISPRSYRDHESPALPGLFIARIMANDPLSFG